ALFVALGDVLGLAFLLLRVLGLLSAWHVSALLLVGLNVTPRRPVARRRGQGRRIISSCSRGSQLGCQGRLPGGEALRPWRAGLRAGRCQAVRRLMPGTPGMSLRAMRTVLWRNSRTRLHRVSSATSPAHASVYVYHASPHAIWRWANSRSSPSMLG